MVECCPVALEPCHVELCDGLGEVVNLLPSGSLWSVERGGVYASYIRATGHIKSKLNERICQEQGELNPCTSVRLFDYWASVYSLPPCVSQDTDTLCQWIDLIYDPSCPIGSLGFYQRVIDFVAPAKGITISVNVPDIFSSELCATKPCADDNPIVITAPPACFFYDAECRDYPHEPQDGIDSNKQYFIPEIECLRRCVLPFGLSIGYKTDPTGPNGEDIFDVPVANEASFEHYLEKCGMECPHG